MYLILYNNNIVLYRTHIILLNTCFSSRRLTIRRAPCNTFLAWTEFPSSYLTSSPAPSSDDTSGRGGNAPDLCTCERYTRVLVSVRLKYDDDDDDDGENVWNGLLGITINNVHSSDSGRRRIIWSYNHNNMYRYSNRSADLVRICLFQRGSSS